MLNRLWFVLGREADPAGDKPASWSVHPCPNGYIAALAYYAEMVAISPGDLILRASWSFEEGVIIHADNQSHGHRSLQAYNLFSDEHDALLLQILHEWVAPALVDNLIYELNEGGK